ncbi:MAG TPA: hypothetical protein VFF73_20245, partial [Planctomycetota bacterium]|nr:hypothetical protein [Planctomycetota bacterium]
MDQTRIEVRGGPTRCPYCHDDVSSGPENVVCRECLARHHPDCWRGACAVCSSSNRLVAEPRPPVTSA